MAHHNSLTAFVVVLAGLGLSACGTTPPKPQELTDDELVVKLFEAQYLAPQFKSAEIIGKCQLESLHAKAYSLFLDDGKSLHYTITLLDHKKNLHVLPPAYPFHNESETYDKDLIFKARQQVGICNLQNLLNQTPDINYNTIGEDVDSLLRIYSVPYWQLTKGYLGDLNCLDTLSQVKYKQFCEQYDKHYLPKLDSLYDNHLVRSKTMVFRGRYLWTHHGEPSSFIYIVINKEQMTSRGISDYYTIDYYEF